MSRVEPEGGDAILPIDPAALQHDAAAIFVIDALDETDRQPILVDGAQPYRIGRLVSGTPGSRLGLVDARSGLVEPRRGENLLDRQGRESGIGDIGVPQRESLLGRLD